MRKRVYSSVHKPETLNLLYLIISDRPLGNSIGALLDGHVLDQYDELKGFLSVKIEILIGVIAQLTRASRLPREGRGFESHWLHNI